MLLQQLSVVVQQRGDRVLGEDVVAYLLLHKSKVLGDVLLVLSIILLAKLQNPITQAEDLFVRRVFGVVEFLDFQQRSVSVAVGERGLQNAEQLLQDVLFAKQFLSVPVAGRFHVEGIFAVLLVLLVGQEVNYILQKRRE